MTAVQTASPTSEPLTPDEDRTASNLKQLHEQRPIGSPEARTAARKMLELLDARAR